MITRETLDIINADLNAGFVKNSNKTRRTVNVINDGLNANSEFFFNNNEKLQMIGNSLDVEERLEPTTNSNVDYTEHLTIYHQIIAYFNFFGFFFGIEVRHDWKMTHQFNFWLTNLILLTANSYIPYNFHYHITNGDYLRLLEPLALCGLLFACDLKWFVVLKHWKLLFGLFFVAEKICKENLTDGTRTETITAGLKTTRAVIKAYTIGVIAVLLFYVAVPIKYYLVDGIFIPLLPIKTPFVDEATLNGWLTASTIQAILGLYSGIATITFGSGFLICICNYIFLVELIALDWKDLNEMWNGESLKSTAYRYMNQVKKMHELKFFVYFIVGYLGEVLCLYQIKKINWIPGYTAAGMVFIEMMFYCCVGTQLSIMDDKMCDYIQQTDWYSFDLYSQKMIQKILHQCQRPNQISLKSLGTLNMVTGIQIIKGIYTYYTILTELF